MISRRKLLKSSVSIITISPAILLAACDGATVTMAQIVSVIQTTCGFITTVNNIIPVVLSILTTFDPSLGEAATVGVDMAKNIEDMVCKAVDDHPSSSLRAQLSPSQDVTIIVNNIPVVGHFVKNFVKK